MMMGEQAAKESGAPYVSGITSGEVITTSLNFMGVPNAIMLAGATPKFADINPDTYNLDPAALEAAVTPRTAAIVVVHLFGLAARWTAFARSPRGIS
jgi:dTDP-4-amino-4,6-dideoxygalactose transaminase